MDKIYDLIIIGAGPAGITAAVYAARKGIESIVITKDIGGQTAWSGDIENYTGYQFVTGIDLVKKFEEHMRTYNLNINEQETVLSISKKDDIIYTKTDKAEYLSKTLIVASGKKSKELEVPGEAEFKNRGLTYCATCDGPLFSRKAVAVIGGGNSALDACIQLMNIAKHIYIINISPELIGDKVMQEKVRKSKVVTILNNSKVKAVLGNRFVSAIKIEEAQEEKDIPVEGVFVEIGLIPNTEFCGIIEKNEHKEIKVNSRNKTNILGIFAAGDVTDVPEKQIIIAAGEGSKAMLGAFRYLSTH